MKKKLILLMLCITLLFGVCGCNKEDNKNNNLNDNKNSITEKEETKEENKDENNISTNENDKIKDSVIKEDENKQEERPTSSNNNNNSNDNNDKKQETNNKKENNNSATNNNTNGNTDIKEETTPTTPNNNTNNNTNNNDKNNDITEPIQEEITITSSNLFEYFEIKREDIIPELNAFGERGTEEDFYYELLLSLKSAYKQKLVSANISVEFASETYLRSFNYNRQTGIGTVTDEYRRFYNNTDKFLCNIKNNSSCYINTCHIAGSEYINDKLIYYAYITEKLEPIRVGGSIILKK